MGLSQHVAAPQLPEGVTGSSIWEISRTSQKPRIARQRTPTLQYIQKVVSSPTRFFALLALAACTACVVAWGTYRAAIDIDNRYQLRARGQIAQGRVQSHIELFGRRDCRRAVLISYSVGNREYTTKVFGCGASPENAPIGKTLEVRYLATNPQISEAILNDTHDGGIGIPMLFGAWGFMVIILVVVWSEHRKTRQLPSSDTSGR